MDGVPSASGCYNVPCMGLKGSDFAPPGAHYQLVNFCFRWCRYFLILLAEGAGAEFSAFLAFCFGWMAS